MHTTIENVEAVYVDTDVKITATGGKEKETEVYRPNRAQRRAFARAMQRQKRHPQRKEKR